MNQSDLTANTSPVLLPGPGIFNTNINNLIPNTTWYYAACANNTREEVRGQVLNFTTGSVVYTPAVYSIEPSSGLQGTLVVVTNLSGFFNESAQTTDVVLSRSGTNITAANVTVMSSERIACNLSLPTTAEPGLWQVAVQQDGRWSRNNVTFSVSVWG